MGDKVDRTLYLNVNTDKKTYKYDYNVQELWKTMTRPNLRLHGIEQEAETNTV